jgi:hypothetical protein
MSRQLPIPFLAKTSRRSAPHTPAAAPKSASPSIALTVMRLVAPNVATWYWPRRQLIQDGLRQIRGHARERAPEQAATPRRLRFHSF